MHDIKNFYLAWITTIPYIFATESSAVISVVSAIVLPTIFFAIGKTADIILQIYFRLRDERQKHDR